MRQNTNEVQKGIVHTEVLHASAMELGLRIKVCVLLLIDGCEMFSLIFWSFAFVFLCDKKERRLLVSLDNW